MKLKWKALLLTCVTACSVAIFVGCTNEPVDVDPPQDEYGKLCIEDCKVYISSDRNTTFAEINPVFTKPEKAEELVYTYDTADLKIENNIVTPLKREDKTVNVRAKSEHFNTVFKVEVEYIRFTGGGSSSLYDVTRFPVADRAETCKR